MMQNNQHVFEIAILGRVTWNLHSLNNEGSVGNVTEPRTLVLWNGNKTDGVSGEMMKHIHAYWTWLQARSQNPPPLCSACQTLRPQRADADRSELPRKDNAAALRKAISRCVLCDLHGFLVQKPTIHRQSTVEFGWIVGIPDKFHRDFHIHARHAIVERGVPQEEAGAEGESETEESESTERERQAPAQVPYHRPTRSGVYAFVTLFQPWRIGLNEVNYTYAINEGEHKTRYQLALTAYEWTFKRPDGAMTSTRLPHIEKTEGIVLISRQAIPVPMLSPLREDYRERLEQLAQQQGVEVKKFEDLNGLVSILVELRDAAPLRLFGEDTGKEARRRGRARASSEDTGTEASETPSEGQDTPESEENSE
ncbi:MAG: DevR family CRISPR-associated autoregulator [Chloroflexota bacterium]